jgi:peptidoglycan/LPS O-acetylase OafA/YrhL
MSRKSATWILILFVAAIWAAPVVLCWRKGIARDDAFQVACIIAAPFIVPRIVAWHSRSRGKRAQTTPASPRRDEAMNRAEVSSICLVCLGAAIASNASSIAAYNHVALGPVWWVAALVPALIGAIWASIESRRKRKRIRSPEGAPSYTPNQSP